LVNNVNALSRGLNTVILIAVLAVVLVALVATILMRQSEPSAYP